jgi:hypothetical protein
MVREISKKFNWNSRKIREFILARFVATLIDVSLDETLIGHVRNNLFSSFTCGYLG